MDNTNNNKFFKRGIVALVLLALVATGLSLGNLYENNPAGGILVVQAPWSGKLTVYTTSGMKWQGWGKVTHYNKSSQFWFSSKPDQGHATDESIKVRFNEGGHGKISGAARYDLPLDEKPMLDLHQTYGSQQAIDKELIRPVMEKSVYMSGPLMSSKESFSEKRADLINLIEDQAKNGIFQTNQVGKEVDDLITGTKKWATVVELRKDANGNVMRQEPSPLIRFNIKLYNISINDIDYEDAVVKQIATQQQASMAIQTAIANSRKAEQDVLTAEAQGRAAATKAKWEQEVIKATKVTEAEQEKAVATTAAQQRLDVAELDRKAAEATKQKEILLGEGESTRSRLNMQANGALEQKLATYEKVQAHWAGALASFKGALVPAVVMGDKTGGVQNNSADLINMLNAKTAKDLALDFNMNQSQPGLNTNKQ